MKKNLIIKLAIALGVVIFGYGIFWFFKVGQVEKQLQKFISENGSNISVAELRVSGFPVSQKISIVDLKLTIPTALFNKKQIIIKNFEASASLFSKDFTVKVINGVSVSDIEKGVMAVEFSKDPEITFTIANGRIEKLSYSDMGYRISDNEKNLFYSASKSTIDIKVSDDEANGLTAKIIGNIAEIQGYSILDLYKSGLEKKIIDGIKTEEIVMGSSPISEETLEATKQEAKAETKTPVLPVSSNPAGVVANNAEAKPSNAPTTDASQVPPAVAPQQVPATIADSNIVKSNVTIDIDYVFAGSENQAPIPSDPNQVQEIAVKSNKNLKINNIEFSNPLYKILVNGQLKILQDDNLPSGGISIKVENIDNLVNHIVKELEQITSQTKPSVENPTTETSVADASVQESYKNFLRRIAINLPSVNREIASKNPVSKENIAQYDLRREKNLDFIINEISIHEVLGKF